jgi:hypothetical protein
MPTIPTPPDFTAGQVLTAAELDSISEVLNFWASPPRVQVYDTTALTHTTSSTWYLNTWDSELYDTDTMHSTVTNTSRITIQTAGVYEICGQAGFSDDPTGTRGINIRLNAAGSQSGGTSLVQTNHPATPDSSSCHVATPVILWELDAGDYLEMFSVQRSGASLAGTAGAHVTFLRAALRGAV